MNWVKLAATIEEDWKAPIPAQYQPVIDKVKTTAQKEGLQVYVVGGFVRDLLLGRTPSDIDFMVEGEGAGIKLAQAIARDYNMKVTDEYGQMGTVKMIIDGIETEFAMARKEYYPDPQSRKPKVVPGTAEEDAQRRDFGVNALFLRLSDMKLLDYTGHGLADLEDKVIRIADPKDPDKTFSEDPLRMLRAVRFYLQLGFELAPETVDTIRRNAHRLQALNEESVERIKDELLKMLKTKDPGKGIKFLVETGLNKWVIPELDPMVGFEQPSKYHKEDVFEHTTRVLDQVRPDSEDLRLAALLHDVGKLTTRTIEEGVAHFFGHEDVSAEMAEEILRRLRFPNKTIEDVKTLIRGHMRPHQYKPEWNDKSVRKLMRDMGPLMDNLLELAEADVRGASAEEADVNRRTGYLQELRERIAGQKEEMERIKDKDLVSGDELMAMFGRGPGKWIKSMKSFITDKQLENTSLTKDEALRMAQEYYDQNKDRLDSQGSWLEVKEPWINVRARKPKEIRGKSPKPHQGWEYQRKQEVEAIQKEAKRVSNIVNDYASSLGILNEHTKVVVPEWPYANEGPYGGDHRARCEWDGQVWPEGKELPSVSSDPYMSFLKCSEPGVVQKVNRVAANGHNSSGFLCEKHAIENVDAHNARNEFERYMKENGPKTFDSETKAAWDMISRDYLRGWTKYHQFLYAAWKTGRALKDVVMEAFNRATGDYNKKQIGELETVPPVITPKWVDITVPEKKDPKEPIAT